MAEPDVERPAAQAAPDAPAVAAPEIKLESSTYEIIRNRMNGHAQELRGRLAKLNDARKLAFGSIDTALLGTERISTAHNCVPRDMVSVGNRFLFGYNVHFGLKSEIAVADVFSVYAFTEGKFHPLELDLLDDTQFQKEFQDIYRYYKRAIFSKFFRRGPYLYMVFRVGKSVTDIKTFKWAIDGDNLAYMDSRSDHEVRYPPQHDFAWTRATRDQHQSGEHPHISIDDRVFVETVGGDLTIKVENNTDSGEGIYSEPVDDPDQTLDDAQVEYAIVGNIVLLKIRPYQERDYRYLVYNAKVGQVIRLDAIDHACVLLPDDHGLIFSNGYYLQTGEYKAFESQLENMLFERRIESPNGEDFLYVFYNRDSGAYILLQYNLIEQKVSTPIVCHGSTLFEGGELICFRSQDQPQKHHALQTWQTPYVGDGYEPPEQEESFLQRIGNKDIVRGMAECYEVLGLVNKEDTYADLYIDLVKITGDVLDSYFWIDKPETFDLAEPLTEIRSAAGAAIDEFDKVVRVKRSTTAETLRVEGEVKVLVAGIRRQRFEVIGEFVESLATLRRLRGDIIALKELRYANTELADQLEAQVVEQTESLSRRCVEFLMQPASLAPYEQKVQDELSQIDGLGKGTDARKLEEEIAESATDLEMLIEIVSNLQIDDAIQRTTIIDNISTIFSTVNQARAALKKKARELMSVEGVAEFNSQLKLLDQSIVNFLDVCDTPERCDEFLNKVMIQIEELEGRFAEFDEFVVQLSEKRNEIYNAFETRKLQLVEARNKRASALAAAADRILGGIQSRVASLESVNDIHGYFAGDLMIEKIRDLVEQLNELDDSVKADEILGRMKTIREDTVRQLKDRQDLFVAGDNIIQLGNHHFSVNVQTPDLTTVLRDGEMFLHLTGTNFFEVITDEQLTENRDLWQQELVSESGEVYRAEFLASLMFDAFGNGELTSRDTYLDGSAKDRLKVVQEFMGPRYSESYVKGVHDYDARSILDALLEMDLSIGLLRFHASARALARTFWTRFASKAHKQRIGAQLAGFGRVNRVFPGTSAQSAYVATLTGMLQEFVETEGLFEPELVPEAANYLFEQISAGPTDFVISQAAAELLVNFKSHLKNSGNDETFGESLKGVVQDPAGGLHVARDWVEAFVEDRSDEDAVDYIDEAATLLLDGHVPPGQVVKASAIRELIGIKGGHPVIDGDRYRLHYNRFMHKLRRFREFDVPRFGRLQEAKKQVIETARETIRLEEFRPRVLSSFVRNKLIDSVYLPMVGDNLAKQVGVVGENKRTDLMGLLLLVSPPGYGKTTLMEYLANRLGLVFMKINGPAIGHQVTALDPVEAPNAAAREELEKLNLALEMGDNVMIYVDDIQHTNTEFLQKFISLCDAQRKIEGVYKGRPRTYDLRGRKVCVVMAGNPYTESGEKFQIPDMLANRADIYNLGEIIGENAEAFELSFLENALTSNPALNQLASRSQDDVYAVIRMAQGDPAEGIELDGNYSAEQLAELIAVMQKLMRVRDVVLAVNREYIRSAATDDDYRTEPAFKLQGSYRNMNRIAEKVVPIMNDDELESLIMANYENDSQTLTSDTEANMLKFKELVGNLSDEEQQRWNDITKAFQRNVKMRGIGSDDKVGQVVMQLSNFGDGLDAIRDAMAEGISQLADHNGESDERPGVANQLAGQLDGITTGLEAIRTAMAEGLDRMATGSDDTVVPPAAGITDETFAGLKESLDGIREALGETRVIQAEPPAATTPVPTPADAESDDEDVDDDVDSKPDAQTVTAGGQTITVVNKIPQSLLKVLRQQFRLMEGWMEPILQHTSNQQDDMKELRQRLEKCLENYEQLIGKVQESRERKKRKPRARRVNPK